MTISNQVQYFFSPLQLGFINPVFKISDMETFSLRKVNSAYAPPTYDQDLIVAGTSINLGGELWVRT